MEFIYEKTQVQEFLETKSNDNKNLRRSLQRRGYTVSIKNGIFTLDKEMKVESIETILGFKPKRPETMKLMINVLLKQKTFEGTFAELTQAINEAHGTSLTENNVGDCYRELVKHDLAMSSDEAKNRGFKELRRNGRLLTQEDKEHFFSEVHKAEKYLQDMGYTEERANKIAYEVVSNRLGNVNNIPFKKLNFKPDHVKWFDGR